jgi:hypothetical protein
MADRRRPPSRVRGQTGVDHFAAILQTLMHHFVPITIPYTDDDYKSLHFCPRFNETFPRNMREAASGSVLFPSERPAYVAYVAG